jgi:hypothetical protein
MARNKLMIWVEWKQKYFSSDDWTGQIRLKWREKLGCARRQGNSFELGAIRRFSASGAQSRHSVGHPLDFRGDRADRSAGPQATPDHWFARHALAVAAAAQWIANYIVSQTFPTRAGINSALLTAPIR